MPEDLKINVVNIYKKLEDREVDLITTLVDLFDLLNTEYSNERVLLDYVRYELEGYPNLEKVASINDLPSYRKLDIKYFKLPQRSEPLKLIKIIERMEGKTIITPGLQQLRDGYVFDHIEDNIFIQNRAYEWTGFPRDEREKSFVDTIKDNPPKEVDADIILKMESGIRKVLCLKLKTTFPQIQELIFNKKIRDLAERIMVLEHGAKKSRWFWKNLLRSKTGENKVYWGFYISKQLIDDTVKIGNYCIASKTRILGAITALTAGGSTIWFGVGEVVKIILKYFGFDL